MYLENIPTYDYAISKFNYNMHVPKTEQKQVFLKAYGQIVALKKAINTIQKSGITKITVSVLGNFSEVYFYDKKGLVYKSRYIQGFFNELLGTYTEYGSFYNTETGAIFVTGFLIPMFIRQVGEKKLGALSGGPYGVLRGLGVSETKAASYVDNLSAGTYLLLARGNRSDIEHLEDILESLET